MKTVNLMMTFVAPLACALALVAAPRSALAQTVKIDGSSTVFPITEAVAEEFQI